MNLLPSPQIPTAIGCNSGNGSIPSLAKEAFKVSFSALSLLHHRSGTVSSGENQNS